MPLPQKKLIPSILLALMLAAFAAPPLWWSIGNPPVIDPAAAVNNKGPANIGQAKHMAQSALAALRPILPTVASQIEADLTAGTNPILSFTIPDPKTPEWIEKQKAPLLIGQLKAIAAPFYTRLHAAAPTWLEAERTANSTNHPNSIFPWTSETTDDANKAIANIGQLKAVFSLKFDSIPPSDSDGNGLSDSWELQHFGRIGVNPDEDEDRDGFTNFAEQAGGTDPLDQASYPPGTPLPNGAPQLVGEQLTFRGIRWGESGFQDPAKKYLRSVYHTVNTVTPGPDTWGFAGDETVTLTTDVRTGAQTRSSTDTPTTNWANLNPWIVASDVSRSQSGIHSPWSVNSNTSQILSDEYTIPAFVANVESWFPAYQNKFTVTVPWIPHYAYTPMFHTITAHISLTPEATDPYPAFYYYITKLKYKWKVNAGQSQVVNWLEVFTPEDGSSRCTESKSWAANPTDTESPVYEIDPTTKNGKKNGVYSLLPVEVKEVWSNQIADVEVNGFPDKTGRNNQPYSIMGVRDDGNAYIRLKLKSAIPAVFRQKILFRLRQPQVSKPGSSSFRPGGDVVDVIAENVSDNPEINHRVYFGYDSDGNGELSEAEALVTVYSTVNRQDKIPVEFKLISKTRHEQSRQNNIEFAGNGFAGIVPNMAPTGASLIKSFHKALPPDSNTTNATTIDRTGDNRLSHPVGVAFEPTEVSGDAVNGVYNRNHLLAENVLKSQAFRNACRDGFDTILPILISRRDTTGISEDFLTFTWEETVGDPSLNFRLNQNSLPNMPDFDSFLALGKVRVENARIGFSYDLDAQFVEVFFQGTFKDLYDFDYDDSFDLTVWSVDEIRQGAETQAGYPTLTKGGKVFTTQLDIRNGEEDIDTGYSFFLYK